MPRIDLQLALHPHQWDAAMATHQYPRVWLCGGLGAGKTHLLVWWLFLMAAHWAKGIDALLFEPDFATYRDVFLPVWRKEIPKGLWKEYVTREGSKQIDVCDSTIFVRSAMNAQTVMRSEGLTTVGYGALDEPARMLCGAQAWTNTVGRCRVPMPKPWRHNPILLVGSPRGLYHWTAEAFGVTSDHPEHGYRGMYRPDPVEHPGYAIRACRTKDNAENLSESYEANARAAYSPALAAQEFGASLISTQGMIFPEWSPDLHVIPNDLADSLWSTRALHLLGGADQGSTAPAAALVMAWTPDQELLVIDEWYATGKTVIEQGAEMRRMEQHWVPLSMAHSYRGTKGFQWYYDPHSNGTIDLYRRGFEHGGRMFTLDVRPARYHGSSSTHAGAPEGWEARVDLMRSLMVPRRTVGHPNPKVMREAGCPRLLVAERCRNLIREIPAYRTKEQVVGRPPREGAVGDDHAIDSVAGAAITTAVTSTARTW